MKKYKKGSEINMWMLWGDKKKADNQVRIVVPTFNSMSYIDVIIGYYKCSNVDISIFVDDKSSDDTMKMLKIDPWSRKKIHVLPNSSSMMIEDVIEYLSRSVGVPWVLRIDDDELPSAALLKFMDSAVWRDDIDVYGFQRYQCIISKAGKLFAHTGHDPAKNHRQWRLYRADRVQYSKMGHSPGFESESVRMLAAPDDACMVHLDWMVHSYKERRDKIDRYDSHTPGHGSKWRDYYLFEERGIRADELMRLELPEFKPVCQVLSQRFAERCLEDTTLDWPATRNVES